MTNTIAIGLGIVILSVFALDFVFFGGGLPVFLGQKVIDMTEYLAIWR